MNMATCASLSLGFINKFCSYNTFCSPWCFNLSLAWALTLSFRPFIKLKKYIKTGLCMPVRRLSLLNNLLHQHIFVILLTFPPVLGSERMTHQQRMRSR